MEVPQVDINPHRSIQFRIQNNDTRKWFEYEFDMSQDILGDMDIEIKRRGNLFAFCVFKELEEKSRIKLHETPDDEAVKAINEKAREIKNSIMQKHRLNDRHVAEYRKQIPEVSVCAKYNSFQVVSVCVMDDSSQVVRKIWFEEWIGRIYGDVVEDVENLRTKIEERFRVFLHMVRCKIGREIQNVLYDRRGNVSFKDKNFIALKSIFDEKVTAPILDMEKWIDRVSTKANPEYIPGTEDFQNWDLIRTGRFAQVYVSKTLHKGDGVTVLGVENKPWHPGTNPNTRKPYDADMWLECDGVRIPVQVGVRDGELARKVSDATVCLGEEIQPNEAVSKFGGMNMDYGQETDFQALCKKLDQVPPGGVVLWVSQKELLPGSGPRPLKEWYWEIMDKKCVIVWVSKNKATIHHNNTGFDLTLARKLCMALGIAEPNEQTHSEEVLTGDYAPDSVEGSLRHLAYKCEYSGRHDASAVVSVDDSASVLYHVVESYMKSVAGSTNDRRERMGYVSEAISILKNIAVDNNLKPDQNVWVEICGILQDVASGRHEDYVCENLHVNEVYERLHLEALFCLTCVVIYKLRDETPPGVLETLTAAAKLGGQEGREHRIVLGYALIEGLQGIIPDWYAENESLLFGEDSPDGMSLVLMRVYLRVRLPDKQTMEKYHTLVLEALSEEMLDMRVLESKTGNRSVVSDPVKHFMICVLYDCRGYGIEGSVRDLVRIGPDAVSMAGHECGQLIHDENIAKNIVERAVQFWETVLDSSPDPAALYGFGSWSHIKSVNQDTWERLMLCTCEIANGVVENPTWVIERASSGCNPTTTGIQIIESILRADRSISSDLAIKCDLIKMRKNKVLTNIE